MAKERSIIRTLEEKKLLLLMTRNRHFNNSASRKPRGNKFMLIPITTSKVIVNV